MYGCLTSHCEIAGASIDHVLGRRGGMSSRFQFLTSFSRSKFRHVVNTLLEMVRWRFARMRCFCGTNLQSDFFSCFRRRTRTKAPRFVIRSNNGDNSIQFDLRGDNIVCRCDVRNGGIVFFSLKLVVLLRSITSRSGSEMRNRCVFQHRRPNQLEI